MTLRLKLAHKKHEIQVTIPPQQSAKETFGDLKVRAHFLSRKFAVPSANRDVCSSTVDAAAPLPSSEVAVSARICCWHILPAEATQLVMF